MRLLARRAHGRAELSAKMRQRGYVPQEIDEAIDRAVELGLMPTDAATALRYAEELAARKGATPRWVRQKLSARGLSPNDVETAVGAVFADWDPLAAAADWAGSDQNLPRVARRLERRGFPTDVIMRTVRRRQSDPEER